MAKLNVHIRPATQADLEAINRIIEAAVMTWDLPERVKRLSLASYRYTALDFQHLDMVVAEDGVQHILGVAAWEQAEAKDCPKGHSALLLHGIYVDPSHHRQGIGHQLYQKAELAAPQHGYDGLLVKAQKGAEAFFLAQGMQPLEAHDPKRDYAGRFWKQSSSD